jgi:hypothetical protein
MAVTSAFPQVINALISQLGSAAGLSGVRIFDGVEVDWSYPKDFIAVGHDGSDDGQVTASSTTQTYQQLGNIKEFEDGQIDCFLSCMDGTTNLTALRTRAATLISAVDTALRADASLGGTCLYSILSNTSMTYIQSANGAAVNINFSVSYRART